MLKAVRQRKEKLAKHLERGWAVLRTAANGERRVGRIFQMKMDAQEWMQERLNPEDCKVVEVEVREL